MSTGSLAGAVIVPFFAVMLSTLRHSCWSSYMAMWLPSGQCEIAAHRRLRPVHA